MALSWPHFNSHSLSNPLSSTFPLLSLHSQSNSKTLKFKPYCTQNTAKSDPQRTKIDDDCRKKKRNPKPSFYDQIREKWSIKTAAETKRFPWQIQEESTSQFEGLECEGNGIPGVSVSEMNFDEESLKSNEIDDQLSNGSRKRDTRNDSVAKFDHKRKFDQKFQNGISRVSVSELNFDENRMKSDAIDAQLNNGSRKREIHFQSVPKFDQKLQKIHLKTVEVEEIVKGGEVISGSYGNQSLNDLKNKQMNFALESCQNYGEENQNVAEFGGNNVNSLGDSEIIEKSANIDEEVECNGKIEDDVVNSGSSVGFSTKEWASVSSWFDDDNNDGDALNRDEKLDQTSRDTDNFMNSDQRDGGNRLPWMARNGSREEEHETGNKVKLAEKMIPEHELKRLRNVALRMYERIKIGKAGVTQALVENIHEKWKIDEVVKLKFEAPPALNMKRTHEILERKTGGLVIWRSGSSVVLFRGLTYKLDCVQTYNRTNLESSRNLENSVPDSLGLPKDLSEAEINDMNELNDLLDELGPRFKDWSGRPPPPVDADLLPGVVPGYKTPFRLLPHGVRRPLRDKEMTDLRHLARKMPPHFALGRNRELQGLAAAMVKLWEKSAIAKIAIKRGVLGACNDRMAEQLKRMTGGTLISRNKDFIVFYRGNDFLPPPVTKALTEREKLTGLQHLEEEARRAAALALMTPNPRISRVPLVAGTLAETMAATSRWGKQPSSEDLEKMMKDSAIARHASLVRYLGQKLYLARGKLMKAERALAKVLETLEPQELPTDLETITDEERLVFRKMGLSMKPYLLLGRRDLFDGTVENIHLHWKFRELVKIIVRGKSFAQVKHIAISLEAETFGVLVSIDKTIKGYAIIIYRGKNYQRPLKLRPRNLLSRRQALARSIELQRREALKHHVSDLQEQIELLKSELEDMRKGKKIDEKSLHARLDALSDAPDTDMDAEEGEEAYLPVYDSGSD